MFLIVLLFSLTFIVMQVPCQDGGMKKEALAKALRVRLPWNWHNLPVNY
jgi:hypothetical protein